MFATPTKINLRATLCVVFPRRIKRLVWVSTLVGKLIRGGDLLDVLKNVNRSLALADDDRALAFPSQYLKGVWGTPFPSTYTIPACRSSQYILACKLVAKTPKALRYADTATMRHDALCVLSTVTA